MSIPCKMIPLGNSGLPNGYKRLEYIENVIGGDSNSASILTDIYPTQNTRGKLVAEAVSNERSGTVYMAFGCNRTPNAGPQPFGLRWINSRHLNDVYFVINNVPAGNYRISDGIAHTLEFSKESFKIDGVVKYTFGDIGEFKSPNKLRFLAESPSYAHYRCFRGKAYSFKLWENDMPILDYIPALNPSGVPGMFDTVAKTFKKSATSTPFTAGMNLRQVRDINLPVPGTVNKLSLSIPCEVYNDTEAWGAIEAAQQKGWTFAFYWTNVVAYLTPQLNAIVGSGNYTISYNYQTSKLSLTFVLSVTREQIDEVNSLLESVLSSSIMVEIAEIPIDVTKVEFLESTKTQYITTDNSVTQYTGVRIEYKQRTSKVFALEEAIGTNNGSYFWFVPRMSPHNVYSQEFYYYTVSSSNLKNWGQVIVEMNYKNSGVLNMQNLIGDTYSRNLPAKKDVVLPPLKICGRPEARFDGWIWSCEITEGQETISKFVPVLDNTGTPCMYDTVMRKPFYNAATTGPNFIAGLTMTQALNLANLPATGGSLTVSLPLEAAFDTNVQRALNTAVNKGWTIIVQYRESDLTTANIDADFLESTGSQFIKTGLKAGGLNSLVDFESLKIMSGGSGQMAMYLGCYNSGSGNGASGYQIRAVQHADNTNPGEVEMTINGTSYNVQKKLAPGTRLTGEINLTESYISINDVKKTIPADLVYPYPETQVSLFAQNTNPPNNAGGNGQQQWIPTQGRVYKFLANYAGVPAANYIPVIDSSGIPCMHDTVSGQNFYNANTAEGTAPFTVGFETTEKAAVSLSKLPITTAGTLTVSLPAAAQDTASLVPEAINIATKRGWTIITQYRED